MPNMDTKYNEGEFQHTAARRRLLILVFDLIFEVGFNTQPRGGGCRLVNLVLDVAPGFNTQPRGGGCILNAKSMRNIFSFNTQPRGGGCSKP